MGINELEIILQEDESFQSEGRIRFDELTKMEAVISECLERKAYAHYIELAGISNVLHEEPMLQNLGCAVKVDGQNIFTNAGVLFFANEPTKFFPHVTVVCALYKGTQKVTVLDRKDLTGDALSVIDDALIFLKKHLKLRYEITGLRRKEILEIPEVALREAVVNAVCHRD